jgi:hypothetical protein
MRRSVLIAALVLAACFATPAIAQVRDVPPEHRATVTKPSWEAAVDAYSPAERQVLRSALRHALSGLRDRGSEFKRAAAINAYLHQYLLNKAVSGNGVAILRGQHAACGGTANAMQEMLYLAGIKSRPAALLGVPYQGNHALVEVQFSNGARGVFDPTFGVFFYDRHARRPVSMGQLLRHPRLAATTLMKSRFHKRRSTLTPVVPITSIANAYRLRHNYREIAKRPGDSSMDWPLAFRVRLGGGVGGPRNHMTVPIRLRAGTLYGTLQAPSDGAPPWSALSLAKDSEGTSFPLAFQLGRLGPYAVSHRYRIKGLRPGRRYRLSLVYARAEQVRLQVRSSSRLLVDQAVPDLPYVAGSPRNGQVLATFTARRRLETLYGHTPSGVAMLQAIFVLPVAEKARGSMASRR